MPRLKSSILVAAMLAASTSHAADVTGHVTKMQLTSDGLYFSTDITNISTYCSVGWYGMTMFVPIGDPNFALYVALVTTAYAKPKVAYFANIDGANVNTARGCDITKTGYGIALL